jgi:hypothetical protein
VIAALSLIAVVLAGAASAEAQMFFASRPSPQLAVTPLFVVADIGPELVDVSVQIVFSVLVPPTRSALDFEHTLDASSIGLKRPEPAVDVHGVLDARCAVCKAREGIRPG